LPESRSIVTVARKDVGARRE